MGGFAPKGHARLDPRRPMAFAFCDRCEFLYNRRDLTFQMEWYGNQLRSTRWLVCPTCVDQPNPTMQAIKLPADPVPILNPRAPKKPEDPVPNPDYVPPRIP